MSSKSKKDKHLITNYIYQKNPTLNSDYIQQQKYDQQPNTRTKFCLPNYDLDCYYNNSWKIGTNLLSHQTNKNIFTDTNDKYNKLITSIITDKNIMNSDNNLKSMNNFIENITNYNTVHINNWIILINSVKTLNDLLNVIVRMSFCNIPHFFKIDKIKDFKHHNCTTLYINFLIQNYNKSDFDNNEFIKNYKNTIHATFKLFNLEYDDNIHLIDKYITPKYIKKKYNDITVKNFINSIDIIHHRGIIKHFWKKYLKYMGLSINSIKYMYLSDKNLFVRLNKLLDAFYASKSFKNKIKSYLIWKIIFHYFENSISNYDSYLLPLKKHLYGIESDIPLNEKLIKILNIYYPRTLNYICIKYLKFDNVDINFKFTSQLFQNLKKCCIQLINNNPWTNETKKNAILKINLMQIEIGFPNFVSRPDQFDEIGSNHWLNIDRINNNAIIEIITDINNNIKNNEWDIPIYYANAYYEITNNKILFPLGLLFNDIFNKLSINQIIFITYILAHEMMHAFDTISYKFDHKGRYKNWWDIEDKKNYKCEIKKIEKHFTLINGGNKKISINTIDENIADILGLKLAYYTCTIYYCSDITNFSKIFFKNYSKIWRTKNRENFENTISKSDEHSLSSVRINGPLSHLDFFYTTYNIQPSDKLYIHPSDRFNLFHFISNGVKN
jgi:predicted metalloendopeptidase